MTRVALVVEMEVYPEYGEVFADLIQQHAMTSLQQETGCLQFAAHIDKTNRNRYVVYELFKSARALEKHRQSPHQTKFRQTLDHMVKQRKSLELLPLEK